MKKITVQNKTSLRKLATGLLLMTTSFAFSGCMEDTPRSQSSKANEKNQDSAALAKVVIDNIAQNVIVATYRDLRDRTQELADSAMTLKNEPTSKNLQIVQEKWRASRVPWESSEGFLFGPVNNVDKQIDVWPLSKVDLDSILATPRELSPEFTRSIDPSVKGFHTGEYLLFGDGIDSNRKTIEQMSARQIDYLVSVTRVIAEETQRLYSAWIEKFDVSITTSPSYLSILMNPGFDNQFYGSTSSVLQEFVQGLRGIAVEVGSTKLAGPLAGDIGSADSSLVESQFSWNSLSDFQNNIHSMQNVYTGDYGGRRGPGLDEIVVLQKPELNSKILEQMARAEKAIRDIGGPNNISFSQAIKNPEARAQVTSAIEIMSELEKTIENELLPLFQ